MNFTTFVLYTHTSYPRFCFVCTEKMSVILETEFGTQSIGVLFGIPKFFVNKLFSCKQIYER